MSHDLFDDLLAEVPRHVSLDAQRAWRAGTRRRRVRHAAEAAAVLIVVAVVGLGLGALHDRSPVEPAGPTGGVSGYPRELPRPLLQRTLPARPGPLAGGFAWQYERGGEALGGWSMVSASGTSWRLPGTTDWFQPALSDDGVMLGTLEGGGSDAATFVLRNLVTGQRVTFPQVGDSRSESHDRYMVFAQQPAFWSPDGTRLLVAGKEIGAKNGSTPVLDMSGEVDTTRRRGNAVGWLDDDHLAWLDLDGPTLVVTDTAGQVQREVALPQLPDDSVSQWSPRLSPDGSQLAVAEQTSSRQLRVATFDVTTGEQTGRSAAVDTVASALPVWHDGRPLLWTDAGLVDPWHRGAPVAPTIAVSPRWSPAGFAQWTAGALAGPAHDGPGLLDVRFWPLWWHWPWLLAGAIALVLAAAGLLSHARRASGLGRGAPRPRWSRREV